MSNSILQINQKQAERLKELGYHLQQFRQKQQMSLEAVAAKTMIPVRLLMAIEAGNLEQLPEPVYIQGFIRRYADAIGMNGAEFAGAFPTQTDLRTPKSTWRETVQAQLRPLHLYMLYMVLVISAVSGLSYLLNRSSTPEMRGLDKTAAPVPTSTTNFSTATNGTANVPQPETSALSGKQSAASAISSASTKSVRVGLTLTSQSWIRIVADGKTEFEGVLSEGTQRAWEASKQLTVRAGNAGGVMVSLNEGTAKRLGEPGAVEEVTFGSNAQAANFPSVTLDSTTLTASRSGAF